MPPMWLIALLGSLFAAQSAYFKNKEISGGLAGQKARLGLENKKFEAGTEASKRMFKERRAMTKDSYERLSKLRREDREMANQQNFQRSQNESANRQLALIMAATQAMTGAASQNGSGRLPMSMVDILRR